MSSDRKDTDIKPEEPDDKKEISDLNPRDVDVQGGKSTVKIPNDPG